jgi:hypothetical protein
MEWLLRLLKEYFNKRPRLERYHHLFPFNIDMCLKSSITQTASPPVGFITIGSHSSSTCSTATLLTSAIQRIN